MGQRKSAVESMVIDRSFWQGRHIFLTGHTGFKGSWLSLWLQHLGAHLTGYALDPPTKPSLFEVAGVGSGMESITGDIRDLERLAGAMRAADPEIVIHLAAQPLVRNSYLDPVGTYATNIMGTVHVLEVARHTPTVRVVLNVTSDKCYDNREWLWGYREDEPMGGHDPYSSSKGCAELVTAAYRRSFFDGHVQCAALASARAGNVIGGGDWAQNRLVPDAVRAFAHGETLRVRSPQALRPWQHVLEPLTGYLMLCEKLWSEPQRHAEPWNFGPREDEAKPVSYLAQALVEQWGENAAWEPDGGAHPHEACHLKLDASKARARLGWQPRWSLDQALTETVAWYKAWQAGQDIHAFTRRQIDTYKQQTAA